MDWYSLDKHFENPQQFPNFDLLARVTKVPELDTITGNYFDITIEDENAKSFLIRVAGSHKSAVRAGMVVKLRSIEKIETGKLIPHTKFGAVLPLPDYFYDHEFFLKMLAKKSGQATDPTKDDVPLALEHGIEKPQETRVEIEQHIDVMATTSGRPKGKYQDYPLAEVKRPNPDIKPTAIPKCSVVKHEHQKMKTNTIEEALTYLESTSAQDAIVQKH